MDDNYEKLLTSEFAPLIPFELLDDYSDFMNENLRNVMRANCLRRYLEGIVDLLLEEKIIQLANMSAEDWGKINLNNKIQKIGKLYDKNIENKFHQLRTIGNKGSHFGDDISHEDLMSGISIATTIVEDIIVKYFIDNQFGSQPPVLTLLSALPPVRRIYILETLSLHDPNNLIIVDKLSMAYLKSGQYEKSLAYLAEEKDKNILDEHQYEDFIWKINALSKNLNRFDIAKNIIDVQRIFELLATDNMYTEYPEFVSVFLVLTSGYNALYSE